MFVCRCTVGGLSVHADLRLVEGREPLGLDDGNPGILEGTARLRRRSRTELP
jgi:hypothetical protein